MLKFDAWCLYGVPYINKLVYQTDSSNINCLQDRKRFRSRYHYNETLYRSVYSERSDWKCVRAVIEVYRLTLLNHIQFTNAQQALQLQLALLYVTLAAVDWQRRLLLYQLQFTHLRHSWNWHRLLSENETDTWAQRPRQVTIISRWCYLFSLTLQCFQVIVLSKDERSIFKEQAIRLAFNNLLWQVTIRQ